MQFSQFYVVQVLKISNVYKMIIANYKVLHTALIKLGLSVVFFYCTAEKLNDA